MDKYGFVYVWFDKKHRRYYVGSHWGSEDDKYVCSSNWMKNARKRRIGDFKRRTVSFVYTNKKDLQIEEQRWLDMIKESELGKRYYNLKVQATGGCGKHSEETKQKMSLAQKGKKPPPKTPEFLAALSERAKRENTGKPKSEASKQKMSETKRAQHANGVVNAFSGRKHSKESLEKISKSRKGKCVGIKFSEERKQKIREAALRREAAKRRSKDVVEVLGVDLGNTR